ncbi:uroporphyrin-III C-methyltransferase [Suillus paluster]|uniref:uroporphyrin-III C-methyltransferase n=1 Tax=Suillus paluster TaxID=48578 RepID=UPI001B86605A|nr:uroporphyrin-III C-methyltransferase [Suillus paluster]KAG1742696.1 uroporphyrin-III C-methyltransferase [Suillus paluster]
MTSSASSPYPAPVGGASLFLTFKGPRSTILIIGGDALAASRAFAALEAGIQVIILTRGSVCDELKWRANQRQIQLVDWDTLPSTSTSPLVSTPDTKTDAESLSAFLTENPSISIICITIHTADIPALARICHAHNIPVNVTDHPALCDFSFAATHRFADPSTGGKSALQVGVTTNGEGCRLAGRVRREIVSVLPKEVAGAVRQVGKLRYLAKNTVDQIERDGEGEEGEDSGVTTPNRPVPGWKSSVVESKEESSYRRMKWVAQVSEYWPIARLASMSENEMELILTGDTAQTISSYSTQAGIESSLHNLTLSPPPKKGRILLVGSGPGHPSLLTIATHNALTKYADLVLSDKLVPAAVLALIPERVEVRIARKFPGNAEGAQLEMMDAAVEAARRGLTVVRLKQGDPVVYGRAGEEVLFFRARGFEPLVVPGVSSALAAPIFAGIPVTQRGVAESVIVCTGVGRQGKEVKLPGYERARTVLILMGVARIAQVVGAMMCSDNGSGEGLQSVEGRREGRSYPRNTPIAIIERGSMPDQRVVASTLGDICEALDSAGEQRPPGMMVVGWAVLALQGTGDTSVLDEGEEGDEKRVRRWLGGDRWVVREGIDQGWAEV